MLVYCLRHGDAVPSASFSDSERPLSGLGKEQAGIVGDFLGAANISFDAVISSPLVRAVETATVVGKKIGLNKILQSEYLVPGSRKEQLLDLLNVDAPKSVLLVGHEPHLGQTVSFLLTGHENLPLEFKKCTLACLLASDPVRKGHAVLQWFITIDHMRILHQ